MKHFRKKLNIRCSATTEHCHLSFENVSLLTSYIIGKILLLNILKFKFIMSSCGHIFSSLVFLLLCLDSALHSSQHSNFFLFILLPVIPWIEKFLNVLLLDSYPVLGGQESWISDSEHFLLLQQDLGSVPSTYIAAQIHLLIQD